MTILKNLKRIFSLRKIMVLAVIAVGFFLALIVYSNALNTSLKEEAIKRLEETSQHNGTIVRGQLLEKQVQLKHIADTLESTENIYSGDSRRMLEKLMARNFFDRVGIVYLDGSMDMIDNLGQYKGSLPRNITNQEFFKEGAKGNDAVVRIDDKLVFSVPFRAEHEKIQGVVFATYDAEQMAKSITFDIFGGEGYLCVTDKNGNKILSSTTALRPDDDSNNIFINQLRLGIQNQTVVDTLYRGMRENKAGLVRVENYGRSYLYYQPLYIDELYLMTIIPRSIVDSRYDVLMSYTYRLFAFLVIVSIIAMTIFVVSDRRQKKKLADALYTDRLTGGYSQVKFDLEANQWLKHREQKKAIIVLDVDNFKLINTLFGYERGNAVLSSIWQIISSVIGERGIFARKYADVFSIMLKYNNVQEVIETCERIVSAILAMRIMDRKSFRIIPSLGVYIMDAQNELESAELLPNYAIMAKDTVKNKYDKYFAFYTDSMKQQIVDKKNIVDEIREALKNKEFKVYFQPQYDAKTKRLVGAEALIRWIKPDGSIIAPFKFIPIAEEMGVIVDIDDYIFNMVCSYQHHWQEQGMKIVPVSVNISRSRLYMPGFLDEYTAVLDRHGVAVKYIQLEITEGTLFAELKVGEQLVKKMREAGFDVLIDDFGTGYSSISMVKDINASKLKIDKSFVDDMSDKGRRILRCVIKIAQTMDMKTVAEGVETKAQYEFLRDSGCDSIQGYYFAKPMPGDDFEALL